MAECIKLEPRYIDINKFSIPKGFFNQDLNVPKIFDLLYSQPAADVVEVVHGHWKGIELKDTCSVCNRSISEICDADSYIEIEVLSELIACPFCGAKMDGERRSI